MYGYGVLFPRKTWIGQKLTLGVDGSNWETALAKELSAPCIAR